ncbi:MAG: hypothetical protein AAF249_09445 [Pseudomonadota bacterium]
MDELRDNDIEPRFVEGRYGQDIDRLIADVVAKGSKFVICDHRLQTKNMASFNGSRVIAALKAADHPAMLLTMYQSTNRLELREARAGVPVIVSRHDFAVSNLGAYAEICRREIANDPVDERRPHQTLVSINDIRCDHGMTEIDITIPSWRPDYAMILPTSCVPNRLLPKLRVGDYLLGDVNTGAKDEDDLFFTNLDSIIKADDLPDL